MSHNLDGKLEHKIPSFLSSAEGVSWLWTFCWRRAGDQSLIVLSLSSGRTFLRLKTQLGCQRGTVWNRFPRPLKLQTEFGRGGGCQPSLSLPYSLWLIRASPASARWLFSVRVSCGSPRAAQRKRDQARRHRRSGGEQGRPAAGGQASRRGSRGGEPGCPQKKKK